MKLLLTGDLHNKSGINTRLLLDYLDYLQEYYNNNNLDKIIILGDLFHKNSNIKADTFVPFFLKFWEMKQNGVEFIFLVGNHDIYNRDYDTIVDTFSPLGLVIKQYTELELGGKKCGFLPYLLKPEDFPKNITSEFLFTHLPIANFTFDNMYHVTEKHAFGYEYFKDFSQVFSGHFHRHQHQKNITYVGSPIQLYRGEIGQKKGFIVFDTDTENWDFIEYTDAPKYIEIHSNDLSNIKNLEIKGNFVVVYINEKIQDFAKFKYILYEYGAIDVIPIFEKEDGEEILEANIKEAQDIEKITREFILQSENIDNKKILLLFDKIVRETGV